MEPQNYSRSLAAVGWLLFYFESGCGGKTALIERLLGR